MSTYDCTICNTFDTRCEHMIEEMDKLKERVLELDKRESLCAEIVKGISEVSNYSQEDINYVCSKVLKELRKQDKINWQGKEIKHPSSTKRMF